MTAEVVRNDGSRTWHCTAHGLTCAITVGTWTGRRMVECVVCGAYTVIEAPK